MRFNALVLLASAIVLGACGGGNKNNDSTAAGSSAASAATTTPSTGTSTGAMGASSAAAAPAAGGAAATPAPATGATHEVKMIGDAKGYRFEPATLTIKKGDAVKFTMVSGGPHDVAFDESGIPAGTASQLSANMSDHSMGPLASKLVTNPGETITVSFANLPAGVYNFHCTPHLAMGMKGAITVQ